MPRGVPKTKTVYKLAGLALSHSVVSALGHRFDARFELRHINDTGVYEIIYSPNLASSSVAIEEIVKYIDAFQTGWIMSMGQAF